MNGRKAKLLRKATKAVSIMQPDLNKRQTYKAMKNIAREKPKPKAKRENS